MKLKQSLKMWFIATLLLFSVSAFAESPSALLQRVADRMVSTLANNKSQLKNRVVIQRIVNSVLVPYIDMNRMAGMVVGRKNWYDASPAQRRKFVAQFKRVVINTYANALASYDDDRVQVYPIRGAVSGRTTTVNSVIIRKNGQRIPIKYKLINTGGVWKVYDFSIEGVSIVSNYRSQFAGVLMRGGLKALNAQLHGYAR